MEQDKRDGLVEKIRALMAKTVENGCTEQEAMTALAKARAMMDAYEVTDEELALTKEEKAVLFSEPKDTTDPHGIKWQLCMAIAKFCECKTWMARQGKGKAATQSITFCGLRSDAQLATWLMDTLTDFVQAALVDYLAESTPAVCAPRGERRRMVNGFVAGCTTRISERLSELYTNSKKVATSNSTALVVVKGQLIRDKMQAEGIVTRASSGGARSMNAGAYGAGKAAGDRASFGRPVSGEGGTLRLK